jgi:hypothetical protein
MRDLVPACHPCSVAGGRKLIAETRGRIAVADAIATTLLQPAGLSNDLIRGTAFEREISCCFGVMPSFFCSASAAPGLIEELWRFAKSAYIDSPLPSLFKERLFVHLSRFCEVR